MKLLIKLQLSLLKTATILSEVVLAADIKQQKIFL